ncbi:MULTISPECIES: glycosyl hydrolase family 28-related protein [Sphingobacterium]|uniref:glycosyl hydrolase family 28-related protein n=1 Tax=Sphingobacterium TaxID=28453 RepID=UPI00257DEB61|nr:MULTISPECIES: glycosyl hydrolase family 28-related protein [Sphingobacterium]
MANQFLVKETMDAMRNLSTTEIDGLKGSNPTYAGVQLLGYYEKGDTPTPIIYHYIDLLNEPDPGPDDGGSIVAVGGLKLLHLFQDGIDVRYYGAKGDNLTDDTAAFVKALSKAKGQTYVKVSPTGSKYVVGDITLPPNTTLRGTGASPCAQGIQYIVGAPTINTNASTIRVKSGSSGFICSNNNVAREVGGLIENIAIEGNATANAFGIKINSTSWGLRQIAIVGFTNGYGIIMGNCWRENYYDLKIRRCGIGLFMDGDIGPVNGCNFTGLMIESVRIGIYQRRSIGGSSFTSNTFVSPIIEDLRVKIANEEWNIPTEISVPQNILDNLELADSTTLCAGILTEANCNWLFDSIYTEAIDGVHVYAGLNCLFTFVSGYMIQGHTTATAEKNWRGSILSTITGEFRLIGTKVTYNADHTIFSKPLFTIQLSRANLFKVDLEKIGDDTNRPLYRNSSVSVDFNTNINRYNNSALYEMGNRKIRNYTAEEVIKSPFYITDYADGNLQSNANNSIDISTLKTGTTRYNLTINSNNNYMLTIDNANNSRVVPGQRIEVHVNAALSNGGSYSVIAGTNVVLDQADISNISRSGRLRLDFLVLDDRRMVLIGVYRVKQSAAVFDVAQVDSTLVASDDIATISTANAIDPASTQVLVNELKAKLNLAIETVNVMKSKYNLIVPLVNTLKAQLNAKLAVDRKSGLQSF